MLSPNLSRCNPPNPPAQDKVGSGCGAGTQAVPRLGRAQGVWCCIQALDLGILPKSLRSTAVIVAPRFVPDALRLWGLTTESSHPFAALPSALRELK